MISAGEVTSIDTGYVNMPDGSTSYGANPSLSISDESSPGMINNGNALMWGQSAQAVGSMVNGIGSYISQKKIMGIKEEMAIAQYDHQDRMSGLNKDMQMETLRTQEAKGAIQVEGNRKYLAANRERRKADGELKVAETRKHETELTEKAGSVDKKALQQIFDQYAYGNPLHA
jgi:hypothetical protein